MSWEAWGTPEYLEWPDCETCGGTGSVEKTPTSQYWWEHGDREQEACPDCDGKGVIPPDASRMEGDVI